MNNFQALIVCISTYFTSLHCCITRRFLNLVQCNHKIDFFYLFSHRQEKLRRRSPSPCTDNERLADTTRRLLSTPSSATAQTQHRSRPRRRHVYIDTLHGEFISRATSQLRVPSLPTGKSLNLLTNRSLDSLPVAFLQVKETKLINFNFSPPDTYE